MQISSNGPHRAFMGVGIVLVVVLSFGLLIGWRWYFGELDNRRDILLYAAKEEAKAAALGLTSAPRPFGAPTNNESGSGQEGSPSNQGVPLNRIAPGEQARLAVPRESQISELNIDQIGPDVAAAESLLKRYWSERSWENRLPMVRDADRVRPLMQTYYEAQVGADPLAGALLGRARFRIDGIEVLHFSFESSRPSGVLEVAMIRDRQGVFKLDWESLVGYCDKTFVQLRLQRPTEPTLLRTVVQFDDYYNFEFDDPERYHCLKLISPDGGYSIFAYAERESVIGEWLAREMAGQKVSRGLTVAIAYPANAQSDQCVRLESILADRWLILP